MFSQFYASGIYLNPALGGLEHRVAISTIYRNQWMGINTQNTNLVSLIVPYHDKGENSYHKGGLGLNALSSRSPDGTLTTTYASLSGAYNLHIAATTLQNITFGLQLGIIQKQFAADNATWGSQYTPGLGYDAALSGESSLGAPSKIVPEIGAGLLYYYNAGRNIYAPGISGYVGMAASHLNRPNEAMIEGQDNRVPILFKVHGGVEIHVAKKLNMSPNFFYLTQGKTSMLMVGDAFTFLLPDHDKYFQLTRFVFGASARIGNASSIIFQSGFGSKYYSLGFSYDYGANALTRETGIIASAYELSLKLSVHISKKAKKASRFHTPLM